MPVQAGVVCKERNVPSKGEKRAYGPDPPASSARSCSPAEWRSRPHDNRTKFSDHLPVPTIAFGWSAGLEDVARMVAVVVEVPLNTPDLN